MSRQSWGTVTVVVLLALLAASGLLRYVDARLSQPDPTPTTAPMVTLTPQPATMTAVPMVVTRVPATPTPEPAVIDLRDPTPTRTPMPALILIDPTDTPRPTPTAAVQRG